LQLFVACKQIVAIEICSSSGASGLGFRFPAERKIAQAGRTVLLSYSNFTDYNAK
jgi:hypothetical protein